MSNRKGGIQGISVGRSDVFRLRRADIHVKPGWNARDPRDPVHADHLAMLTASIFVEGVKEPLTVYWEDDKAFVSDGHFRLEGFDLAVARGAPHEWLPVKTEPRGAKEDDIVFSQIVRNSGKRLLPFEQGTVFKRLLGLGWTVEKLVERSGMSRVHIANMLELVEAPPEVGEMVQAGKVSARLALDTMRKVDRDGSKAVETLKRAVEAAEEKGRTRAAPKDVEPHEGERERANERERSPARSVRSVVEVVKDAFEASEIDNEIPDAPVIITMPATHFSSVRDALQL